MSTIHMVLMGKGGVGKSLVATMIAEHLMRRNASIYCADTDPTNPTFSSYAAFNAKHIKIMTPDMNIDKSNFDGLIEAMLDFDGDCVVDNGASSFLPMMSYMMENDVIDYLHNAGKKVVVHAVLIGGLGMDETVRMLDVILEALPATVVVWENELHGPVVKDGAPFSETNIYRTHQDRIAGIVRIRSRSEDTFGKDMHNLTINRLTVAEAMVSPAFRVMSRQRLKLVQADIAAQLDVALDDNGNLAAA